VIGRLFRGGRGGLKPPLDGITPTFEMVGAVPDATYIRPPGSIVRFGTDYYWQAGTLAAPVWIIFGAGTVSILGGVEGVFRDRAMEALGVTDPERMLWWFYPAGAAGLIGASAVVAGATLAALAQRQAVSSGGGAGGIIAADFMNATGFTLGAHHVVAGGSFYLASRWAHNAAGPVGAGVKTGIYGRTTTTVPTQVTEFFFGIDGATNVNNFVCTGAAGVAMDSGVAINANDHEHEIVHVGGVTRYWIDRVLRATGNAAPSTNAVAGRMASNTAAVLSRQATAWAAVAIPLPAPGP
jgi:hypothetical protein